MQASSKEWARKSSPRCRAKMMSLAAERELGEVGAVVGEDGVSLVGDRGQAREESRAAALRLARRTSRAKANLEVRPMATNRYSLPSAVRISVRSM